MACCGKNNGKYYSCCNDCNYYDCDCNTCCDNNCDDNCDNGCTTQNLTGVSCPFHNNNGCACANSIKDAACQLSNQRVIIHVDGCKMCVVIVGVGECFIKAVNPCTQRIVYFNVNRIDNIEDVLPRCYY